MPLIVESGLVYYFINNTTTNADCFRYNSGLKAEISYTEQVRQITQQMTIIKTNFMAS